MSEKGERYESNKPKKENPHEKTDREAIKHFKNLPKGDKSYTQDADFYGHLTPDMFKKTSIIDTTGRA